RSSESNPRPDPYEPRAMPKVDRRSREAEPPPREKDKNKEKWPPERLQPVNPGKLLLSPPSSSPGHAQAWAPAVLVVYLPADARLTIDDVATQSTTGERRFRSPPLESRKEFRY